MDTMKRIFTAVAGIVVFTMGTVVVKPARAALLDFNFTGQNGTKGSFTLDTDVPRSPVPSIGIPTPGNPGILYPNAISNFFFSSPQLNVNGENADWEVIPSIVFGPPGSPILSGISYPSGCSATASFTCLINVGVGYSGTLPKLSDDPNSYPIGLGIDRFDPITFQSLGREQFTSYQVVRRQTVPESNSSLSLLAFGVAGLLLKGKIDKKTQTVSAVISQ